LQQGFLHEDKAKLAMTGALPLILRLMRTYVRPHVGIIAAALGLMLVSSAMTGAMAKLMEPIIDKVFADKNGAMLLPVALGVFAVFTVRGLSSYGHTVLLNNLGSGSWPIYRTICSPISSGPMSPISTGGRAAISRRVLSPTR